MQEWNVQDAQNLSAGKFLRLIWLTIKSFFKEKIGIVILSAILLIMLWGYHGNLDLLQFVIKDWSAPGLFMDTRPQILSWVPWDRELISFWMGAFLLVIIPTIIIRFGFKHRIRDYGLALPTKEKRTAGFILFTTLVVISIFPFYLAAKNADMQLVYPFYKQFFSITEFVWYELSYFPFFFAIEFIFRGYLLFGISNNLNMKSMPATATSTTIDVGKYAVIISMLSYTAWHLGKPLTELWGTPIWGLVAGVGTYYVRSIWPVLTAHFLLNVFLDAMILHNLHLSPF